MILDTNEYMTVLRDLVEDGHEVTLQISGDSMFPFLCSGRDTVFFQSPDTPLCPGQIVFYQRAGGQFVLHRICRVSRDGIYLAGDAQTVLEGPIPQKAVFARVTRVIRREKQLEPGDICWSFYAHVWRWCRPFRRPLIRIYTCLSRLCHILKCGTRSS